MASRTPSLLISELKYGFVRLNGFSEIVDYNYVSLNLQTRTLTGLAICYRCRNISVYTFLLLLFFSVRPI